MKRWNMKNVRVRDIGLIEVTAAATIVWGMHNDVCGTTEVPKGHVFNALPIIGWWYDVVPASGRDVKRFKRIGNTIPHTEIDARNRALRKKGRR